MQIYGGTSMHLFEPEFMDPAQRDSYRLTSSKNGWISAVRYWNTGGRAVEWGNEFINSVKWQQEENYPEHEFIVIQGPAREAMCGVMYYDLMLIAKRDVEILTFAKVDVSYGPEDSMTAWDRFEREQWFEGN